MFLLQPCQFSLGQLPPAPETWILKPKTIPIPLMGSTNWENEVKKEAAQS